MKRLIILSFAFAALTACNNGGTKDAKGDETKDDITSNPDYQKGIDLIAKSDCLTCHRVDEELTGPPYRRVAEKYAGTSDTVVNYLAHKIITGGTGVWGNVPMLPHPTISEEDAKTIARYILLLKK